jgi:hypothetical protein
MTHDKNDGGELLSTLPIPGEIVYWANKITDYFAEQGMEKWKLSGIQNREDVPSPSAEAVGKVRELLKEGAEYVHNYCIVTTASDSGDAAENRIIGYFDEALKLLEDLK